MGHENRPTALVDCTNLLASSSLDKSVALWDPTTAKRVLQFNDSPLGINTVQYMKGRELLLSGGCDGVIRVNDEDSKYTLARLREHTSSIRGIETLHEHYFTSTDESGVVKLWDARTWSSFQTIAAEPNESFASLLPVADDYLIKVGAIGLNFLEKRKVIVANVARSDKVVSVIVNMRKLIIYVATSFVIQGYDMCTGLLKTSWPSEGLVLLSQENVLQRQLACYSHSGEIQVLDINDGRVIHACNKVLTEEKRVASLMFVSEDTIIALSFDGTLTFFVDYQASRSLALQAEPLLMLRLGVADGSSSFAGAVLYTSGKYVTISGNKTRQSTDDHASFSGRLKLKHVCPCGDSDMIVVYNDNSIARVSDQGDIIVAAESLAHGQITAITCYRSIANGYVKISESEKTMLSPIEDFILSDKVLERMFHSVLEEQLSRIRAHELKHGRTSAQVAPVKAGEVSGAPDSCLIIIGDSAGGIHLVDADTLTVCASWSCEDGPVQSLHVIRGVKGIVSAHTDSKLNLWSLDDHQNWGSVNLSFSDAPKIETTIQGFPLTGGNPIDRIGARRVAQLCLPEEQVCESFTPPVAHHKGFRKGFRQLGKALSRLRSTLPYQGPNQDEVKRVITPRSLRVDFFKQELKPLPPRVISHTIDLSVIPDFKSKLDAMDEAFFAKIKQEKQHPRLASKLRSRSVSKMPNVMN